MIPFIDFRSSGEIYNIFDIYDKLKEYYEDFDVDDEIDMYREDPSYRSAFTNRQSVKDFEEYKETLKDLADSVYDVVSKYQSELSDEDFENLGVKIEDLLN